MKIGYARVSTEDQNPELQMDALKEAGCDEIYTDTISGSTDSRPQFDLMLNHKLRRGDILVAWKLDRIGRSLQHLIGVVNDLKERGIDVKILDFDLDTSTSGGKLMFHIFGAIAEFERDLIRERTNAGLKAARARGRTGGRPQTLDDDAIQIIVATMKGNDKLSISAICRQFDISRATYYRHIHPLLTDPPQAHGE